jgi:hypothetical protein
MRDPKFRRLVLVLAAGATITGCASSTGSAPPSGSGGVPAATAGGGGAPAGSTGGAAGAVVVEHVDLVLGGERRRQLG